MIIIIFRLGVVFPLDLGVFPLDLKGPQPALKSSGNVEWDVKWDFHVRVPLDISLNPQP